ncbi:unnamed protein product, partial [Symbiodinium sp. KB8]
MMFRRFGYVTVRGRDVQRITKAFHGTKWKGERLALEVARPDYKARLAAEAAQQARAAAAPSTPPAPAADSQHDHKSDQLHIRPRPGVPLVTVSTAPLRLSWAVAGRLPPAASRRPILMDCSGETEGTAGEGNGATPSPADGGSDSDGGGDPLLSSHLAFDAGGQASTFAPSPAHAAGGDLFAWGSDSDGEQEGEEEATGGGLAAALESKLSQSARVQSRVAALNSKFRVLDSRFKLDERFLSDDEGDEGGVPEEPLEAALRRATQGATASPSGAPTTANVAQAPVYASAAGGLGGVDLAADLQDWVESASIPADRTRPELQYTPASVGASGMGSGVHVGHIVARTSAANTAATAFLRAVARGKGGGAAAAAAEAAANAVSSGADQQAGATGDVGAAVEELQRDLDILAMVLDEPDARVMEATLKQPDVAALRLQRPGQGKRGREEVAQDAAGELTGALWDSDSREGKRARRDALRQQLLKATGGADGRGGGGFGMLRYDPSKASSAILTRT